MRKRCCLIAACDPKSDTVRRCRHCGGPWKVRKPYVRPPWERVEVIGINEKGEAIVQKPGNLGGSDGRGGKNGMPDEDFAERYPRITEYLVTSAWDDGSHRKTSSLSLFVEQGVVKLALYDKELGRTLFVAAESFQGGLDVMEVMLAATNVPWVSWRKVKKT